MKKKHKHRASYWQEYITPTGRRKTKAICACGHKYIVKTNL